MNTEDKSSLKINEIRFLIFVPICISIACVIWDLWFRHEFSSADLLDIFRAIYNAFFPSVVSVIFTMVVQGPIYKVEKSGIAKGKGTLTNIVTAFYVFFYILCMSYYNRFTSIIFGSLSVSYIVIIWKYCLDKDVTKISKDPYVEEMEAYKKVINKQN